MQEQIEAVQQMQEYIKPGTGEYVQGVEVPEDYNGEIPDGFDVIELPAAQLSYVPRRAISGRRLRAGNFGNLGV